MCATVGTPLVRFKQWPSGSGCHWCKQMAGQRNMKYGISDISISIGLIAGLWAVNYDRLPGVAQADGRNEATEEAI